MVVTFIRDLKDSDGHDCNDVGNDDNVMVFDNDDDLAEMWVLIEI